MEPLSPEDASKRIKYVAAATVATTKGKSDLRYGIHEIENEVVVSFSCALDASMKRKAVRNWFGGVPSAYKEADKIVAQAIKDNPGKKS